MANRESPLSRRKAETVMNVFEVGIEIRGNNAPPDCYVFHYDITIYILFELTFIATFIASSISTMTA